MKKVFLYYKYFCVCKTFFDVILYMQLEKNMFKLWAKAYDENNKIIKNQTFAFKQNFDAKFLYQYMQVICSEWKTETPVVIKNHYATLANFGHVKFSKSDFIDSVDFKYLLITVL